MTRSGQPPGHIPPARLFRLLLQTPRASLPLSYRFPFAADVELRVQALTSVELAAAEDAAADIGDDGTRASVTARHILAACVTLDNGSPAFTDAAAVGMLTDREVGGLMAAVDPVLQGCSPTYSTSDARAWHRALRDGAAANWHVASALGQCVDVAYGWSAMRIMPRPDRYFGLPQHALTDGQWMAFRAARELVEETRKK